ncbi:uncharacterized protein MEPE_06862 [Melanopsichium pennsylvanicum]|uniref:Uncharacterized protein n=1 Tax=Melanopsichium pennsylvanicum TaxID=63383 RepID=A0AAJ4XTS2_9BASI|nr:uncharacterized protein MEPE_06862 [Melanopsichium pennsylvanicum]
MVWSRPAHCAARGAISDLAVTQTVVLPKAAPMSETGGMDQSLIQTAKYARAHFQEPTVSNMKAEDYPGANSFFRSPSPHCT